MSHKLCLKPQIKRLFLRSSYEETLISLNKRRQNYFCHAHNTNKLPWDWCDELIEMFFMQVVERVIANAQITCDHYNLEFIGRCDKIKCFRGIEAGRHGRVVVVIAVRSESVNVLQYKCVSIGTARPPHIHCSWLQTRHTYLHSQVHTPVARQGRPPHSPACLAFQIV